MRSSPYLVVAAVLSGCGGSEDSGQATSACGLEAETFTSGLSHEGDWAELVFVVDAAAPAPPDKGDNTWTVAITDPAGTPRADLTVSIAPFMPEHGHGTSPPEFETTSAGDGTYTSEPFDLFMAGVWDIVVSAEATDVDDATAFRLCVEG